MGTQTEPHRGGLAPQVGAYGLGRLTGLWFLGLAGIYLLYGGSAALGPDSDTAILERVAMVLGPSMFAFALLLSPSLFAAGIGQVNGLDGNPRRAFARRGAVLALFAGLAYLLSAFGPNIVASLTATAPQPPPTTPAASPPPSAELARHLIPIALATFVLLSGITGILVGHVTNLWRPLWRNAARWISGVTLMASFLLPFLATANAIAQQGVAAIWIIVNPLALPLVLTSVLVVRERDALGLRLGAWWRRTNPNTLDPELVDRIITKVIRAPDSGIDLQGLTTREREVAHLVAAIRRIAAPRATLSKSRVRDIVTAIVEASPEKAPEAPRLRRSWLEPSALGDFCTSWTCLAAGLLIVSPLGGVPISVVSAVAAGFLGSAGIVVVARRCPALYSTVPT